MGFSYKPPPTPPPSPSHPTHRWTYDVFLSFRGEDTRRNFTDHLYSALTGAGIFTFRDDDRLETGTSINSELKAAIRESRISIVVFSEKYATSTWCLEELVEIVECRATIDQVVIPIFYDIDPSDVRKQRGSFERAFADHQRRFAGDTLRLERWRAVLTEAANLRGWELKDANGHEARFIQKIVQDVSSRVGKTYLHIATHPVGIPSRVVKINLLLSMGSNDVRMVGIYGMGGLGKTTIAKAVYNQNFQYFEGSCCFLANVREASKQPYGLVRLQEQLLSELLKIKKFKIDNVDKGISCMENRLRSKRVLIILDDLDNLSQVKSLAGDCNWFGPGSRIIVTTRDEHLLETANINWRYKAKEMTQNERMELFSLHAFNRTTPYDEFLAVSKGIVAYVGGLPLALEVLGCHLRGKTVTEWHDAFGKLQKIPDDRILEKLRISYDGLDDDDVKNIFLDIACFFIGMDRDYAINILKGCGFFPIIGIKTLIDRCLLTVDEKNKLMMHNLIRDMGREIVHKESPNEPGKRSRLWANTDVCYVLEKRKGTEAIQGVVPALPMSKGKPIGTETFQGMHRLRLLQIRCTHFKGSFEHLPEELKWFSWHYCPLTYIPSGFHLENLVVLDMQYSKINSVGQGLMFLKNLEILILSHSSFLRRTPDFTGVPNLKMLFLNGCANLSKFHPSIGHLDRLTYLNLEDSCTKLKNLPSCICELKALEHLNLNGCSNLEELPENIHHLEHLKELFADGAAIRKLPDSLGHLKELKILSLEGCNKKSPAESGLSNIYSWVSNIFSCFSPRRNPEPRFLPASVAGLCSLTSSICELKSLEHLNLNGCLNLEELPENIQNLTHLRELFADAMAEPPYRKDGTAIKQLPDSLGHLKNVTSLSFEGCNKKSPAESGLSNIYSWFSPRRNPESRFLPPSISGLCCLARLSLIDCNLSNEDILSCLGSLSSLQRLRLDGNHFHSLSSSIGQLSKLELFSVDRCMNLQSLPELPTKLVWLHAASCTSMEKLPRLSNVNRFLHLYLMNCDRLASIQGLENLTSVQLIAIEGCNDLATTFEDSFFLGYSEHADISDMCLSRRYIPYWFHHRRRESTISFDIPSHVENKFLGITIWLVYEVAKENGPVMTYSPEAEVAKEDGPVMTHSPEAVIMNKTICVPLRHQFPLGCDPRIPGTHSWVCHVPLNYFPYPIEGGEEMELSFELNQPLQVKECGVHLIFKPKDGKDDEGQFPFVNSDVNSTGTVDNMSFKGPRIVELAETSSELSEEDAN